MNKIIPDICSICGEEIEEDEEYCDMHMYKEWEDE